MESNFDDSDEEVFFGVLSKKEWQINCATRGSPLNITKCVCASSGLMSPSSAAYGTSINVDQGISQPGSNFVDSDEESFFGMPSEKEPKEPQIRSAMKGSPLNITECASASSGLISLSPTACSTSINVDQGKPFASSQAGTAYSASGTFTDNSGLVEEPETIEGMNLVSKDPFIGGHSHISDDTVVSRIVYDMSLSDSSFTGSSQRKNIRNADLSTVDEYDEQGKVMTNLDIGQFASKKQYQGCGCGSVGEDEYLTVRKLLQNLKIVKRLTFKSQSGDNIKANVPSLNLASVPNELVQESSFVHQNMHKSDGNTPQETELSKASSVASCGKRKISAKRKLIFPEDRDVMHSEGEGFPSKYSSCRPDISPSVPDKVSHSVGQRSREILAAKAVFSSPQLRKPHVPAHESKIPRSVTAPSKLHWDVVSPIGKAATQSPPRSHTRRGLSSPSSSFIPSYIVPSEVVQVHNKELMLEEVPEGEKSSPEEMEQSDLTWSYSCSNTIRGQKK